MNKFNFNTKLDVSWESPFLEKNGLLEFKQELINPSFLAKWSFITTIYGEHVFVDHFVVTFPDRLTLEKCAESFLPLGAQIIEGPDIFPVEFCKNSTNVPQDLWLHLLTLLMPSGGLLVFDAPHAEGDQLDRFLETRGATAVHHVAIRVDDVRQSAKEWKQKGFKPLSAKPLNYGSLNQWFLQNSAGQIIELIQRYPDNNATFDCKNIAGLRLSEVANKV